MKKYIKTLCTLAILASVNQASAETFQLGVTGNITPTACTPAIASNGVVDYGVIKTETLNKDNYTWLDEKEITLNISCNAPAKVALFATNGRKGSTLSDTKEGVTGAAWPAMRGKIPLTAGVAGFGLDGETKIGAYAVTIGQVIKDENNAAVIKSPNKNSWTTNYPYSLYDQEGNTQYVTIKEDGAVAPVAFTTATFPLKIIGYVNKTSELDISKPIKLDGLTNIEMVYL
ncbi:MULTISPECIES: DUF1120 domain-containing protein [unclassified Pantoea]|uniref:DUF1120 domain-containing protein n=1 Tax=unclassified Pantoea TaxID=2630326 RepID=UPI00123260D8|nr:MULTISPECIES: DUF1120 domain-containing protein [unclassified Pantoea]KAA6096181.1 DUF1120 domain-containing protein [Pantoea sp. B_9]KAA6110934.1 DUF1120 domain-containing protein [Pantoea sp. B_10]